MTPKNTIILLIAIAMLGSFACSVFAILLAAKGVSSRVGSSIRIERPALAERYQSPSPPPNLTMAQIDRELLLATTREESDRVSQLLAEHGRLISDWGLGYEALTQACESGSYSIAEMLLVGGVDPDGAQRFYRSPLMVAASRGNAAVVALLIQSGAGVNNRNAVGNTPLMAARNTEVTRLLLDAGANPNMVGRDGYSALANWVVMGDRAAVFVRMALEYGAHCRFRTPDGLTLLQKARLGESEQTVTMLEKALREEVVVICGEEFLSLDFRVRRSHGFYVFSAWTRDGSLGREIIIDGPASPPTHPYRWDLMEADGTLIPSDFYALALEFPDGSSSKLTRVVIVCEGDHLALPVAAEIGYEEVVDQPVERGADVNTPGTGGKTSLMVASENGHEKVVARLLSLGADTLARDHHGLTAMTYATRARGNQRVIDLLAQHESM